MTPPRWHGWLFAAATVMTWILVSSGGVICITDASQGCPDWPVCHGRLIPPAQMNSILEWSHRVASPITLPFIIAAAVVGWRRYRAVPWIARSVFAAIGSMLIVVGFGAAGVFWGLSRGWAAADLGTALLALAFMVTAATMVRTRFGDPAGSGRLILRDGFTRVALAAAAAVYAVLVSGVLVARPGSVVRCLGWPSWTGLGAPTDVFDWLALARLALAVVASLLVLVTALRAWRISSSPVRFNASACAALLLAATVAANLVPAPDEGVFVPVANMIFSGLLWSLMVAVVVRAAASFPERSELSRPRSSRDRRIAT
jgi:heme A synthase